MRTLRAGVLSGPLLLAGALLFSGCGGKSLFLTLDLQSFLDPENRQYRYGEDPVLPPGIPQARIFLAIEEVNLVEGLGAVSTIEEGTLTLRGRFENETGSATGQLRLFLSDSSAVLLRTPAVFDIPIQVSGADTVDVAAQVDLDRRVLDLLERDSLHAGLVLVVDTSGSSDPLLGTAIVETLEITVRAKQNLFL